VGSCTAGSVQRAKDWESRGRLLICLRYHGSRITPKGGVSQLRGYEISPTCGRNVSQFSVYLWLCFSANLPGIAQLVELACTVTLTASFESRNAIRRLTLRDAGQSYWQDGLAKSVAATLGTAAKVRQGRTSWHRLRRPR
jgi:hypothetical protein